MMPKILVIDDEKGFTDMLKLTLEATGKYMVKVENNPHKALNAALQYQPQVVLLDVIMPNMEGPDVAIEFQDNDRLKKTPIIFLTATVTKEEVGEGGSRIGRHTFLAKPSRLENLLGTIEEHLLPSPY